MTDDPPVNNVVKKYDGTVLSEGVIPADRYILAVYKKSVKIVFIFISIFSSEETDNGTWLYGGDVLKTYENLIF